MTMKYIPARGRNTAQEPLPTAVSRALRVLYLVVHIHISVYNVRKCQIIMDRPIGRIGSFVVVYLDTPYM